MLNNASNKSFRPEWNTFYAMYDELTIFRSVVTRLRARRLGFDSR